MPDVRLPNGKIVKGVPEGMGKAELMEKLVNNNVIDRQTADIWLGVRPEIEGAFGLSEDNPVSQAAVGLGSGFTRFGQGVKQLGLEAGEAMGMVDEGEADRYTKEIDRERTNYENTPIGQSAVGKGAQIAGEILPAVPIGMGVAGTLARGANAVKAGNILQRTSAGGKLARTATNVAGGAAGGASAYVPEGESRAEAAAIGGAIGGVAGPLINALSKGLQRAYKGVAQKITGKKRFDAAKRAIQGMVDDADVDRIAQDVADGLTPEQAVRKFEIEKVGATPTRGRVTGDIDDLRFENEQARFAGTMADVEQQNRQAFARKLDDEVSNMTSNPDAFDAGSRSKARLETARRRAQGPVSDAYQDAEKKLLQKGDAVIRPQKFMEQIAEEIDFIDTPEMKPLMNALKRTGLLSSDEIGEIAFGTQRETLNNVINPKRAEALRRTLNTMRSDGSNRQVKRKAGQLIQALEEDVKRDIGEDVFSDARAISKAVVKEPFDNNKIVNELIQGKIAPERIAPRLTQAGLSVDDTSKFFKTLDNVDKNAANQMRGAVLEDLLSSAKGNAVDASGIPSITPAQFAKKVDKIGRKKMESIFGKKQALEIKRLSNTAKLLFGKDARVINPGTAAEFSRRLAETAGSLAESIPVAGKLFVGLLRAARKANMDKSTERQVRRALNIELLKRENVLSDLLKPSAAPVSSAVAGQQGAQAVAAPGASAQ